MQSKLMYTNLTQSKLDMPRRIIVVWILVVGNVVVGIIVMGVILHSFSLIVSLLYKLCNRRYAIYAMQSRLGYAL